MKTTALTRFLDEINDAFARADVAFFAENVTDDVRWMTAGEPPIEGKEAVLAAIGEMGRGPLPKVHVDGMITHGREAAVYGTMRVDVDGAPKTYALCDIYRFNGFSNTKIRERTTFLVEAAVPEAASRP